jgi:hypothetical protein
MNQPIKINTGKYIQNGKVEIDGHVWTVKMPGAGTELRYSQAQRGSKLYGSRLQLLDKKIDNGTITEEELDKYEEYSKEYDKNERIIYDVFAKVFQDGTKDNSEVNKWLEETSLSLIILAFEEISQNADNLNSKIKESDDGEKPKEETAKEDKESS